MDGGCGGSDVKEFFNALERSECSQMPTGPVLWAQDCAVTGGPMLRRCLCKVTLSHVV